MNDILFPVFLVSGIGLALGIILAIVSVVMDVPANKKVEELKKILPGANCGACGYSGCNGYAEALYKGEAKNGLCTVGGEATSKEISKILGIESFSLEKKAAVVKCLGHECNTGVCMEYKGIKSCAAVSGLCGSDGKCSYGCIGFGDCVKACQFGAISICDGIAVIDNKKCTACGDCVSVCPKQIIKLHSENTKKAIVYCSNKDIGATTRKACISGCIGCMQCVKECEYGAIKIENNLAVVDSSKCTGCGKCTLVCKPECIKLQS